MFTALNARRQDRPRVKLELSATASSVRRRRFVRRESDVFVQIDLQMEAGTIPGARLKLWDMKIVS